MIAHQVMSIARDHKVFLVCLRGVAHFVGLVMMLLVYLHGIVGLYDREYDVVDVYRSEEGIVDESNSYFNLSVNLRGVAGGSRIWIPYTGHSIASVGTNW
jgi:hypothetical protein